MERKNWNDAETGGWGVGGEGGEKYDRKEEKKRLILSASSYQDTLMVMNDEV